MIISRTLLESAGSSTSESTAGTRLTVQPDTLPSGSPSTWTEAQIQALAQSDIQSLTQADIEDFSATQIGYFTAAQIPYFSTTQIGYLSQAQVAGLTATQQGSFAAMKGIVSILVTFPESYRAGTRAVFLVVSKPVMMPTLLSRRSIH